MTRPPPSREVAEEIPALIGKSVDQGQPSRDLLVESRPPDAGRRASPAFPANRRRAAP